MISETKRYWAFISYSSKDAQLGKWLHRSLENYTLPSGVRGTRLQDGTVLGRNLRPIFRDRDDLPSSPDLSDAIREALLASRYLIVLCSRNAARSEWVDKEIALFRSLGGGNRILALIVDGTPNTTCTGDPEDECFPPQLRLPFEPMAGDLRDHADGKERGLLKLVAGLAELRFDDVYRRHRRSRTRWLVTLSSLATATFLVVLGLAMLAMTGWSTASKHLGRIYENFARGNVQSKEFATAGIDYLKALEYADTPAVRMGVMGVLRQNLPIVRSLSSVDTGIGAVDFADISADGKYCCLRSSGLNVFDISEGRMLWNNELHMNWNTYGVYFSPSGDFIACCSKYSGTRVWDVKTGDLKAELGGASYDNVCDFSRNNRYVLVGGMTGGLDLYDLETQKHWDLAGESGGESITSVLFSKLGTFALVGRGTKLEAWKISSGKRTGVLPGVGDDFEFLDYISKSNELVYCTSEGKVTAVTLDGKATRRTLYQAKGTPSCLSVSPDGHYLVLGLVDKTLHLVDLNTSLERWSGRLGGVPLSVRLTLDGAELACATSTGQILAWRAPRELSDFEQDQVFVADRSSSTQPPLRMINLDHYENVYFSADGKATGVVPDLQGSGRHFVDVINPGNPQKIPDLVGEIRCLSMRTMTAIIESPSPDPDVSSGVFRLADLRTGKDLGQVTPGLNGIRDEALFCANGTKALFWDSDGNYSLWDTMTQGPPKKLDIPVEDGQIPLLPAVALSPDGTTCYFGDTNGEISCLNVADNTVKHFASQNHFSLDLSVSSDGRYLFSGTNHHFFVWEIATGSLLYDEEVEPNYFQGGFTKDPSSLWIKDNYSNKLLIYNLGLGMPKTDLVEELRKYLSTNVEYQLDENQNYVERLGWKPGDGKKNSLGNLE